MYELNISDEEFDSLDECIDAARNNSDEMFAIADLIRGRGKPPPKKRRKNTNLKTLVFARFNTKLGKPAPVTLRVLLDSGASGTLVAEEHAKKLRLKKTNAKTVWTMPGGALKTTYKCKAQFTIPELHDNRLIEWNIHVSKNLGAYDMIIGRDLLEDLGIDLKFSSQTVEWDDSEIPFKESDAVPEIAYHIREPSAVDEATEHLKSILDAKYEAADLEQICKEADYLSTDEQDKLITLLCKYETLFDGTLGQ